MTTIRIVSLLRRRSAVALPLAALASSLLLLAPVARAGDADANVATVGGSAGEAAQGRVVLAPHWRVGDHVAYLLTHRSEEGSGTPAMPDRRSLVTLDVRAADAQGYVVDWLVGPPPGMEQPLPTDPDELALMHAVMSMPLKLRIDAQGRVAELLNWQEVRVLSNRVMDFQVKGLKARGMSPEGLARMAEQQRARLADEEAVRHARAEDAVTLLQLLGHAYERAQPVQMLEEVASPWGGDPMRATERFELIGLDDKAHATSARMTIVFDPAMMREQYRAMLKQSIKQLGSRGADLDASAIPAFDAQLVFEATVDDASGWPRTSRRTLRASGPGLDMSETVLFERQ